MSSTTQLTDFSDLYTRLCPVEIRKTDDPDLNAMSDIRRVYWPHRTKSSWIYALCEPETGEVRYIGKAKNYSKRYVLHCCPTQLAPKTHRNHWIKSVLSRGRRPSLCVLDKCLDDEWREYEIFWIRFAKERGARLTNGTAGGDGAHKPSAEARWKMGASRRGKKFVFTPEHKAKIAKANRERTATPEWRAKMSIAMRGNKNGLKNK